MSDRLRDWPQRKLSPAALRIPRRHESDVRDYVEAERAERVGDHAITTEMVAPPPSKRSVKVVRGRAPAAQGVIADLLTLISAEARTLRDSQVSNGKLEPEQVATVHKLTDAATKLLREERRQLDLDDFSRLTEEEVLELLPPEVAAVARAQLLPDTTSAVSAIDVEPGERRPVVLADEDEEEDEDE